MFSQVKINENGKNSQFEVTLTHCYDVHLKNLLDSLKNKTFKIGENTSILQMCEVLVKYDRSLHYEKIGRSFFDHKSMIGNSFSLNNGKEGLLGFFSTFRAASWKDGSILLNIDTAYAAFYKHQSVLDFMKENQFTEEHFKNGLSVADIRFFKSKILNLKISVTHTPIKRTYKVVGVCPSGPRNTYFEITNENDNKTNKISVEEYFFKNYKKKCYYPNLNCLHVGNIKKNVYIPIEFCEITKGQKVSKKLDDQETRTFVSETALPPRVRLNKIQEISKKCELSNNPISKALGFSVSDMPLKVNGRVLDAPQLQMQNESLYPRDGNWDIRDKKFFNSAKLEKWILLHYKARYPNVNVDKFVQMLLTIAREKGMTVNEPLAKINIDSNRADPSRNFKELKAKYSELQIVIIILPGQTKEDLYSRIKYAGDVEVGILTQCLKSVNAAKCQPPTISNILLKINSKLDGIHTVLHHNYIQNEFYLLTKPVIIMGADVNHPPADDKVTPSLAAVVASVDKNATKYVSEVKHQKHRVEVIKDIEQITKNLLVKHLSKMCLFFNF